MARRERTQYEIDCAERAKALLEAAKRERGLTQEGVAESIGMTQGALGQYLNGPVVINLRFLLKFSKAIGCAPNQIDTEEQIFDLFDSDEKEIISLFRAADPEERKALRRFVEGYTSKK